MRIHCEADFDTLTRGAQLLAVAAAWTELGLWRALGDSVGPVHLDELARDLPGGTRGLELTLPILAHAGLLEGAGKTWQMTDTARAMYQAGQLPSARQLGIMDDLTRIVQTVREGGPARDAAGNSLATTGGVLVDDIPATRDFLAMLHRRSSRTAEQVAVWVMPHVAPGARLIDVGGGHGGYARTFAEHGLEVTLFDQPVVIELARERYGDSLHHYRAGDFHSDDFGGPYEVAFLSNIVHSETFDANATMMRRLFDALAPGGLLVLKDMFIDEQGVDPERAVFFGLTMLSYTRGGRSYTLADLTGWLQQAGFQSPSYVATSDYTLVLANKRQST